MQIATLARSLGLITRADPLPAVTPPADVTPPARMVDAGSVESALTLESVYRAVQIIGTATSQLTLDVWRGQTPILPDVILSAPNVDTELPIFLAETAAHLATRGNAFWRVERDSYGRTAQLWPIPPLEVTIDKPSVVGPARFWWEGKSYGARDIRHLAIGRGLQGRKPDGLGPIQADRLGIWGAVRVRDYAALWFDETNTPDGTLSTDQHLSAEQATQWRNQWIEARKTPGPAVLGAGLTYESPLLKPDEIQWLSARALTATEVARLFGIPAGIMLAATGTSYTYSNAETDNLQFIRWTLIQYLREIETAFSALLPRGQSARFNLDGILRADTKTRYQSHKLALDAGFRTIEEVRTDEGWTPDLPPTAYPKTTKTKGSPNVAD